MSYLSEIISNLDKEWQSLLSEELSKPYFLEIEKLLNEEKSQGVVHFPPKELIFNALNYCSPQEVKVVVLGQDPYHNPNESHGLAFSVQDGVKIPPSLRNIYKELELDIGKPPQKNGNLEDWARQGVLLLNASLTVVAHQPGSHSKIGWQMFTGKLIELLSANYEGIVFILWGGHAKKKKSFIAKNKQHQIIESVHPSPLSANRGGFFGTKPFSKTNELLIKFKKTPIKW